MKKIITVLCAIAIVAFPQNTTSAHMDDVLPIHYDTLEDYGFHLVVREWGVEQWEAFYWIINKESGWRITTAHYPNGYTVDGIKSSAYGLGGFLDATWETVGCTKTDDGFIQLECTVGYIKSRYDTPQQAYNYHKINNHY